VNGRMLWFDGANDFGFIFLTERAASDSTCIEADSSR
jgi:hypothetical protein